MDIRDLGLFELEESMGIDVASFLLAYLHYWCYDDDYRLAELIDESSVSTECDADEVSEWIIHELDCWSMSHLDNFDDRFEWLSRELPFKVNEVIVQGYCALIELKHVSVPDALLSSAEEAILQQLEERW